MRVTGVAGTRATGTNGELDVAATADMSYTLSQPGDVSSLQFDASDPSAARGAVTRQTANTTDDQVDQQYREVAEAGVVVAMMIFEAAQEKWRSGACVRIESTESTRQVKPNESITFTNKVFHQIDGGELDKKIVATFNGVRSASPTDVEQDPPASITFTAGPTQRDAGTVKLKTTSNRGIGELSLTFTVSDGWSYHQQGGGSKVDGEKCDGLGGTWVLDGTYEVVAGPSRQEGVQQWLVSIDETTLRGTFTLVDTATQDTGTGVIVYVTHRASGDASLQELDGQIHMTLDDRKHTSSATTTKGGQGNERNVPLQRNIFVWEPGAQCGP
jgi:hypothetical protein